MFRDLLFACTVGLSLTASADPLAIFELEPPMGTHDMIVVESTPDGTQVFSFGRQGRGFFFASPGASVPLPPSEDGKVDPSQILARIDGEHRLVSLNPGFYLGAAKHTYRLQSPVGKVTHVILVRGETQNDPTLEAAGQTSGWDSFLILARRTGGHRLVPQLYLRGIEACDPGRPCFYGSKNSSTPKFLVSVVRANDESSIEIDFGGVSQTATLVTPAKTRFRPRLTEFQTMIATVQGALRTLQQPSTSAECELILAMPGKDTFTL